MTLFNHILPVNRFPVYGSRHRIQTIAKYRSERRWHRGPQCLRVHRFTKYHAGGKFELKLHDNLNIHMTTSSLKIHHQKPLLGVKQNLSLHMVLTDSYFDTYPGYSNFFQDLELILFPESTLGGGVSAATEVPLPFTEIICNTTDTTYKDYLKRFSCAAIQYNTTVVVNLIEKENCTTNNATGFCPTSGIIYYNSNVAFNNSGGVVGR